MKKLPGYKNEKELTLEEKEKIIKYYYDNPHINVKEINKKFKLTNRTMKNLFKEFNIDSHKKNRYTINESFFDNIDCELKAYLLGYLFADGFVGDKKYNNIVFSQKEEDAESVELLKKSIKYTGKLRISEPGPKTFDNAQNQIVINFSSKHMANTLRNYGLLKKELYTSFPELNSDLIRHFIRGYFDGDGSISLTKSRYKDNIYYRGALNFIINKNLINFFLSLFNNVHFTIDQSKTDYMIYLKCGSKKDTKFFYDYFYKDSKYFLSRKKKKFDEIIGRINGEIQ